MFFLKWAIPGFFWFIFVLFRHKFYGKNWNRWRSRRARWPLDHDHRGPDYVNVKKWANPGLFLFIFVLFSLQFQKYKLKKYRWCAWDLNPRPQHGRCRRNRWDAEESVASFERQFTTGAKIAKLIFRNTTAVKLQLDLDAWFKARSDFASASLHHKVEVFLMLPCK